ncbi:MFS transporter [Aquisalimonas lutea]|uniref:MFS transporter n=1 Tax=Aquisalimonas lutea TaxID=1327750 RepID=UPI0025B5F680|nr:MFS transporter [Aquisalimonas lutea]MDN3516577.1 MFS transporter [Aquisalimonas lutea]
MASGTTTASQAGSPVRGLAVTALMMMTAILVVGQLYAYLPLLPAIGEGLSTTARVLGWTTPAFALSQAVGLLVVGWLNQRVSGGRLFAAGMSALAVTSAVTGAALAAGSEYGFLLGRAAQGLTAAAFPPFAIAAIVENNGPRFRPTAVALFSASLLMAAPLGQLLAAAVSDAWAPRGVFWASSAALAGVAACLWAFRLTDAWTPRDLFRIRSVLALLHWRALGRIYGVTLVLLMGVVFYYAAIQASESGVDLQLFRLLGAPAVLMTLVAGVMLYRWSSPAVQTLGFVVAACGTLATGLTGTAWGLQVGHWLVLGGVAIAVPAVLSFLGEQSPAHRQRGIVFYTFVLFAGASLGTPLVGATSGQPLGGKMLLLGGVYLLAAGAAGSYRYWPSRLTADG